MIKILLLLILTPTICISDTLKVAVIDTGFSFNIKNNVRLCKYGHKNFVTGSNTPDDTHGHGTNVACLIDKFAENSDFCLVIIKFYSPTATAEENLVRSIKALQYALNLNVNIINYSGGGPEIDPIEQKLTKKILDKNIIMVVAAGNEGSNLDKNCNYYPACYDKRIVVVGNQNFISNRSNYGSIVDDYVNGNNVMCLVDRPFTGTSQATAIKSGLIIKQLSKNKTNRVVNSYDNYIDLLKSKLARYLQGI